jgi:hypothetical protein
MYKQYLYLFLRCGTSTFFCSKIDKDTTGRQEVTDETKLFGPMNLRVHGWFILTTDKVQALGTQNCRVYENLARCCQ